MSANFDQLNPNITVIGGGHGTAAVFPVVNELTTNATAVVSMSDSGGTSKWLMEQIPTLEHPVGDLANVITASSDLPEVRDTNGGRFGPDSGVLAGHSPRNIYFAYLVSEHGLAKGTKIFSTIMQARGTILPVTLEPHTLMMVDGPGIVEKEDAIDKYWVQSPRPWMLHKPAVGINPEAELAIVESDLIVYAPGSPYTSQLAALCVGGVREALDKSIAPKVLIVNHSNEPHDTKGWHVVDYVHTLLRHEVPVDMVIYNTDTAAVAATGKEPVIIDPERFSELPHIRFVGSAVVRTAAGKTIHSAPALTAELSTLDRLAA